MLVKLPSDLSLTFKIKLVSDNVNYAIIVLVQTCPALGRYTVLKNISNY